MPQPPSGWYRDPSGRFAHRYWNGESWTDHVNSGGANSLDPLASQETSVPPAPGTAHPMTPPSQPGAPVRQSNGSGGAMAWVIVAVIVVAAAVAVLFLVVLDDDDTTDTTTPPATTTTAPGTTTTEPEATTTQPEATTTEPAPEG